MIAVLTFALVCAQGGVAAPTDQDAAVELILDHPGQMDGDLAGMLQDWQAAFEADPGGPYALDLLNSIHDLSGLDRSLVDGDALLAIYAQIPGSRERDVAREMLQEQQLRRMFSTQPLELPADLYDDFLTHWEVLGPLGPLDHPAPDRMAIDQPTPLAGDGVSFETDWGAPLEWRSLTRAQAQAGVRPASVIWPAGGASFLRARIRGTQGKQLLELDASGSFEAWWNGQPLGGHLQVGSLREPSSMRATVELDVESWSTLLVRVPTRNGQVRARCLGMDGTPSVVETWSPETGAAPEPLATSAPLAGLERPATRPLPEQELAPALAVRRAVIDRRADRALVVELPAEVSERSRSVYLRERHFALLAANHLPDEIQRRAVLEIEQQLAGLGGVTILGRLAEVMRLLGEDQPVKALQAAEDLEAATVDQAVLRIPRIEALFALDSTGAMGLRALQLHVDRYPEHAASWLRLAQRRNQAGDVAGALSAAWRALVLDGSNANTRELVLELLLDKPGDARRTTLLDVVRRWRTARPADPAGRSFEYEALGVVGADEALVERLREQAGRRPGHPSSWERLAEHHLARGEADAARAALTQLLKLEPGYAWARESAASLGVPDPAEIFFEAFAPDAREALAAAREVTDASTAEALDAGLVYLYPDGSRADRTHTLTVALDRKGTEELHERDVIGSPRLARVLQKSGGSAEPVQVGGKWVMPSLDPGDAVEMMFDRRMSGGLGTVPDLGRWSFTSLEKPFLRSYYALFVPESLGGELRTGHFDGRREARRVEGGTVHVLRAEDRPRVVAEGFMPSYVEILPWAAFGEDKQHRRLVEAWRGQVEGALQLPADLELELDQFLAEGAWPEAPLERAAALWQALEERTLNFAGTPLPAAVWYLRRGNPMFLYTALLERAGVPFQLAVLERPVAPALDPEPVRPFALTGGLDRPALRIGAADAGGAAVLWQVIPVDRGTPFGVVPGNLAGAPVLVLNEAGFEQTSLPSSGLEREWDLDLDTTWRLDEDGAAAVRGSVSITTARGSVLVEQLRQAPANQREGFVRQIVGSTLAGLDLESWRIPALEGSGSGALGLRLEFEGRLPDAVRQDGERSSLALRIPPSQLSTALGPARRTWPLALRLSNRQRVRLRLEPGEHWSLPAAPEGFSVDREGYQHSLEASLEAGGARGVTRISALRGLVLQPAEVPAFLDRAAELEREEARPVPLERP